MKKIISILLVAVLILGMIPATALTAFAEDTVVATFELGANGSATHADGSSKTAYSETDGNYTLTFSGITNMYTGARDAKGNGCIKLGASSKAGGFSFTVPNDVTSVVIYAAKYKANTTKLKVGSTTYTLTKNSNDGAYDAITVDTTSTKTVTLTTVSGGYRAMVNTIEFVAAGSASDCEHTNKTEKNDGYAATCTEAGKTNSWVCDDCGEIAVPQETIDPINHANKISNNDAVEKDCETEGFTDSYYCPDCKITIPAESTGYGEHNYVDGFCSVCEAAEPSVKEGNISFANTTQRTSFSTSAQVWADGDVTFTNNKAASTTNIADYSNPVRLYANSELVFAAPGNITSIVVTCDSASYATTLVSSAGSEAVANGAVVTITPTAAATTYTVAKLTAQLRLDSVTVIYEGAPSAEPDCEHANQTEQDDGYAATCTEEGKTNSVVCDDCGETVVAQQTIPATNHEGTTTLVSEADAGTCQQEGTAAKYSCSACNATWGGESTGLGDHNYVDGECELCGEAEPSEQTINFATADQRVSLDTESQVWKNGNVTFTNNKGTGSNVADYTNPARFYKNSQLVIVASSNITKIVFNCNTEDYATELKNSIGEEATVDGKVVTLIPTEAATTYTIAALTGQVRIDSVTVSYAVAGAETECTHENKVSNNDAQEPTCVTPGQTNSYTCPDCGETIDAEPIPATGEHNYVDGFCTACGAAEPERYYIAAYRDSEDKYYYMTSDLGTASTKRYQAVAADILPSNIDPEEADSNYVFILTDNGDGTYYLQAEGVEGDNYLYHSGTTNSGNYASQENALKLTMTMTEDGKYNFHYAGSDEERYLSLNGSKDQNYFAWYKNTQKYDLTLIPIEEAEDLTATLYGDVDGLTVTGDLTLDLNGYKATNVSAAKIYAYDSSVTYTKNSNGEITEIKEGTGSLTTTATVVTDNTVDGKRYIALKGEDGAYTFHGLELKLSAISLRASAAGIYYKASMVCDATLKAATAYHGMVVSVNNMPGSDFDGLLEEEDKNGWTKIEGAPSEKNFTSVAVFGIFKVGKNDNAARGEMKIYANAYLQLKDTNEIIMADTTTGDEADDEGFDGIAWSLRDVMEALNDSFTTMTDETKKANIVNFYNKWQTAMATWSVGNIAAAATTPAE